MKIEVKLYFFHDMDLITLYRTKNISFPEVTRQVMNAYAEKKAFRVLMTDRAEEKTYDGYRKFMRYRLDLDAKRDMSAINLLNKIEYGYRNNFIKTILRQYLCAELPVEYLKDKDEGYFRERSEILQGKRENVQICRTERKSLNKVDAKVKEQSKERRKIKPFESEEDFSSMADQKGKRAATFIHQDVEHDLPLEQLSIKDFQEESQKENDYSLEDDMNDFFESAIQLF